MTCDAPDVSAMSAAVSEAAEHAPAKINVAAQKSLIFFAPFIVQTTI
jgi:hypothetical protein